MMSDRKKTILHFIVREYVKTAIPVASGTLTKKCQLKVSPATVRNDMAELEEEGYIAQPHTSAGRVPTEAAYELELAEVLDAKKRDLKETEINLLEGLFSQTENGAKLAAKAIAELSGGAVFWAFHKNDLFYTGVSNLFSQPEFKQSDIAYDISVVIDRMEEIIDDLYDRIGEGEQILIGSKNPFGSFFGTVLVKYKKDNKSGIFGILGPVRMDYARNLSLVRYIKDKFA